MSLDPRRRDAYLARLGFETAPPVDAEGLCRLQVAHLRAVPFENLDIHLGRRVVAEPEAVVAKVVDRGRGGFCYELNGAFAELLDALGFTVSRLEARVHGPDGPVLAFDHLCLRVDLDEPWLVDVGFGESFDEPLRMVAGVDQADPSGTWRLAEVGDGWTDLVGNGEPAYRFADTPRRLVDFAAGCEHHQTSPDSPFTRNPVCTVRTPTGRRTLRGRRLVETVDGERRERDLGTAAVHRLLTEDFGLPLTPEEAAHLADL